MAWIIRFAIGLLIAPIAIPQPLRAQEFLKQLEDRLKDAANPAAKPVQEHHDVADAAEELPLPNQKQPNSDPTPQTKRRSPPIVITPKKNRNPGDSPGASPSAGQRANSTAEPEEPSQGYLGLTVEPVAGGNFGLAVVEVTPQSPAWKSGFRTGDRVIGLGGEAVTTIDQFASVLQTYAPGEPIKFLVQRQGRSVILTAVLQDRGMAQRVQGNLPAQGNMPGTAGRGTTGRRPATPYQPLSGPLPNNDGMALGVSVSNLSDAFRQQFGVPVFRGAAISEVIVGSPAERAGLQPGDCIVEIDGRMILFADDVVNAMRSAVSGQTLTVGYYRGARKMITQVPVVTDGDAAGFGGISEEFDREMLTPEYVASLQAEIARLNEELEAMRSRLQDLESRLPPNRR